MRLWMSYASMSYFAFGKSEVHAAQPGGPPGAILFRLTKEGVRFFPLCPSILAANFRLKEHTRCQQSLRDSLPKISVLSTI